MRHPRRRLLPALSTAAIVLLLAASAQKALAQPAPVPPPSASDTDRLNAREQFNQGMHDQQQGHWADALLAFQRAQALFPAPTNMLHIAECEAQLGRLVEAAETYRGLTLLQLPKDAPQPFFAAQAQGAAELQQVEARIPKLRIEVTPPNIPNLAVTLDQRPFNVVLLGADRSVDPGAHTVMAFAPGFGQREVRVVVREREAAVKVVNIALQPTGGVVYTQAVPQPLPLPPPPVEPPPPPPPPVPPPIPIYVPPSTGLLFGIRAGVDVMGGGLLPAQGGNSINLGDAFGNGGVFGLQGGIRFQRRLYLGIIYEHAWAGGGSDVGRYATYYNSTGLNDASGNSTTQVTTNGNLIAVDLGYISNPEGLGIVLDAALAYRTLGLSTANNAISASYNGGELVLGGGVWIKAGPSIRIVPRLDVGIGTFGTQSIQCQGSAGLCSRGDPGSSVQNAPVHAIVFLGVGGYFNLDLGGPKKS